MQAPKILGFTATNIHLQECRGGEQERDAILVHQGSDDFRIERTDVINHSNPEHGGYDERPGKAERVEERQDAEDAVASAEGKRLSQLIGIGDDVVMSEHHALWVTRAAAGENDRGEIIERSFLSATERLLEDCRRQRPRHERGDEFFASPGFLDEFFE